MMRKWVWELLMIAIVVVFLSCILLMDIMAIYALLVGGR